MDNAAQRCNPTIKILLRWMKTLSLNAKDSFVRDIMAVGERSKCQHKPVFSEYVIHNQTYSYTQQTCLHKNVQLECHFYFSSIPTSLNIAILLFKVYCILPCSTLVTILVSFYFQAIYDFKKDIVTSQTTLMYI